MAKVHFFDKRVVSEFWGYTSAVGTVLSLVLIFVDIPDKSKICSGLVSLVLLVVIYFCLWFRSDRLEAVSLTISGSTVVIKSGDIFAEPGFKVIPFNEYFDTLVDERIIASASLNGIFVNRYLRVPVAQLDSHIAHYPFDVYDQSELNAGRKEGKRQKYTLGTICVYHDYLLTAFAKFDQNNRACLTMPEYLEFLINFWDRVNRIYAQKSVSVPIFGSGITRIKEHRDISDENLLKIMLWTFHISEMRFKYPAKLTIVVHSTKISRINLLDISSAREGL